MVFDSEGRDGVRVIEVRRGSPADQAGVRQGDVVVRLNGEDAVRATEALPGRLQAGDTVRLRVRREGEGEREVVVVAGEEDEEEGRLHSSSLEKVTAKKATKKVRAVRKMVRRFGCQESTLL